jgi:Pro-kumamolisin, activation domain
MSTRYLLYTSTILPVVLLFGFLANAAESASPRITASINESALVQLTGNTPPLALPQFDRGAVPDSLAMTHVYVVLRRSQEQEESFEQLIAFQHNPASASYRQWLSADQLGKDFGPAPRTSGMGFRNRVRNSQRNQRGQVLAVNLFGRAAGLLQHAGIDILDQGPASYAGLWDSAVCLSS